MQKQNLIEQYDHPLYKHVDKIKDADAVAYAYVNTDKQMFFPYTQPKLEPNEIRANILFTGLCYTDVTKGRSKFFPVTYPLAPGHEIIAEVSEVGSDVKNFKKGEKVAFGTLRHCCGECKHCSNEKEPLCQKISNKGREEKATYGYHWGGFSTQLQQPADFFFKLKDNVKLEKAAPLLCAGITVYNPIKQHAKPGMKTAVVGIGGLGHLAVMFLKKMGYEVDAITTSISNEEFYKKDLGANNVVDLKNPDSMKKHANQYDFIINTSPKGDCIDHLLDLCAPGAYFCQVGAPAFKDKMNFTCMNVVAKEIHLVGSFIGSRKTIQEMLDFCVDNDIYPLVETYDFCDFPKAFDKLEFGKPHFRCVVDCRDYAEKNGLVKK